MSRRKGPDPVAPAECLACAAVHPWDSAPPTQRLDGLLEVGTAVVQLAAASLALGALAAGPLVAARLVRRWLR